MNTVTTQSTPLPDPPMRGGADRIRPAARAELAVKVYGREGTEVRALDAVSLDIDAACFTAVMGPSGSGKSTLMHCLAGLDSLTSGRVFIGDVDLSTLSDRELTRVRREHIGFIFQSFNLLPTLTAMENITLPMDLARTRPERAWLEHVIDTVGLGNRLKHKPSEVSGGHGLRRSGNSVRIDSDRLVVRGSCPVIGSQWCDVRYTIEVPADIEVIVRGDNSGIRVTGVTGRVSLHSDNGSIHAIEMTSDTVHASTDNGNTANKLRTDQSSDRKVVARTDNGDVTLRYG